MEPPASKPPMTALPPTAAESRRIAGVPPAPEAYLVIMDQGGIFGAYFDADLALRVARSVEGVICTLPIAADFRRP